MTPHSSAFFLTLQLLLLELFNEFFYLCPLKVILRALILSLYSLLDKLAPIQGFNYN